MGTMASRPLGRSAIAAFILLWILFAFNFIGSGYEDDKWYSQPVDKLKKWTSNYTETLSSIHETLDIAEEDDDGVPISYRLDVPAKAGCEDLVGGLQLRLIEEYSRLLKGIRHVNMWGYLETENKGDAAIWAAQQMLLTNMGIEVHESCRYMRKDCDIDRFRAAVQWFKPYSAIMMAGGGNFNDFYWDDQPARIEMINAFHDIPIRMFPQSIYMNHTDRIRETQGSFREHPNLQLAARDQPSYNWLVDNMNQKVLETDNEVKSVLLPDIAFMWGNRPDFRLNTEKTHDILILARDDREISSGNSSIVPFGEGVIDIGGSIGNVTYRKVDWKLTHTAGIDRELPGILRNGHVQGRPKAKTEYMLDEKQEEKKDDHRKEHKDNDKKHENDKRGFHAFNNPEFVEHREEGKNQRAWAKAIAGLELLGSAKFVITDRLHGHILSTVIGVPHVLMDSKLGKNLNLHNTWTQDCQCTRVTDDFEKSLEVARLYFESLDEEAR